MGLSSPATDYLGDYAFMEGVESATLRPTDPAGSGAATYAVKVLRRGPAEATPTGSRLGLAANEQSLWLWPAGSGAPDPAYGDELTIGAAVFTITRVAVSRFGHFDCDITANVVN